MKAEEQIIPGRVIEGISSYYPVRDFVDYYEGVMKFEKNKEEEIHKWYPFVEGYAKEFIQSIVDELSYEPTHCLDPFGGSGTTALHLQRVGIKCTSFEVSPFMHLLSTTKMQPASSYKNLFKDIDGVKRALDSCLLTNPILSPPEGTTLVERRGLKKWIYNRSVMDGILDIKLAIHQVHNAHVRNLLNVSLASILVPVSNVYRNGKCLSYKKNWKNVPSMKRKEVHDLFLTKLESNILPDIKKLLEDEPYGLSNLEFCHLGDSRQLVHNLKEDEIDLLITSPPYLNSRDYTDIYRLELWVLDLVKGYQGFLDLRKETLTSHVQIKIANHSVPFVSKLDTVLKQLNAMELWNNEIPKMVSGYFNDLNHLLMNLRQKFQSGKKAYINVANSAYGGLEIEVDLILAEIAEMNGFQVEEIRKARDLFPSGNQKEVGKLRETVIVLNT